MASTAIDPPIVAKRLTMMRDVITLSDDSRIVLQVDSNAESKTITDTFVVATQNSGSTRKYACKC